MKRAVQIKFKIKISKLKLKAKTIKETMLFQEISWVEYVKFKNIQIKKERRPKNKKFKILLLLL